MVEVGEERRLREIEAEGRVLNALGGMPKNND